jgi:pSer/pThr/pTyr-binding forkhead associated (FHA) protein
MPSLVVIFGRDRGRHFDIAPGTKFTIGRDKHLTHRLNDPSISRKHLDVVHQPEHDRCLAVDLESRNGARINEKRLLRTQPLCDGDIIQVGYTLLVFVCVTFEAKMSVDAFLHDCEDLYEKHLRRLREHTSLHIDRDAGESSRGGMSATLHLGTLFKKKH